MDLDLIKEPEGGTLNLDGKEWKLPAFDLNFMASIEEEFNCDISELQNIINKKKATNIKTLLWLMLKQNYPDITKQEVGSMVTIKNMSEVSSKISEVLGG